MKLKLALLIVAASVVIAGGQTVTVTSRKVTYKRPKPQSEEKKELTINYPKVHAATPAVSRRIERAFSYQSVLGLNLKEEINEYDWLSEADFEVKYNKNGVLCVNLSMDGVAAYPSGTSKIVCVDSRTGIRARPTLIFTRISGLTAMVRKAQEKEVRDSIPQIKKDNPDVDNPAELFTDKHFAVKDLDGYVVSDKGITFHYDYDFAHVVQALQPEGDYFFSWAQLRPYIKPGGLLTRVAR